MPWPRARRSPTIRHDEVRRAKHEALAIAFDRFLADEWEQLTPRAAALAAYVARERWWLDDYALFQALSRSMPGRVLAELAVCRSCPRSARARRRAAATLDARCSRSSTGSGSPRRSGRTRASARRASGVRVLGDLPFVARDDSPEVWSRADEFLPDVSAGVPPDAFSEDGQDWGLPTYTGRRSRSPTTRGSAGAPSARLALFDGVRVDHVVGLFRTYGTPAGSVRVLHAVRRAGAARPGRGGPRIPRVERPRSDRGRSRIDSRLRARVAGRGSAFPAAG